MTEEEELMGTPLDAEINFFVKKSSSNGLCQMKKY